VVELTRHPQGCAVVHEVDDRTEAELGEAREHAIQPRPVEAVALRLHAIPGNAPPYELGSDIRREGEIPVPSHVVLGEHVLVDRTLPGPLLRHEGVLDAHTEVEGTVAEPGRAWGIRGDHLSPVVAMLSMKRRCTKRKPITSGTTATSEPAIMTP